MQKSAFEKRRWKKWDSNFEVFNFRKHTRVIESYCLVLKGIGLFRGNFFLAFLNAMVWTWCCIHTTVEHNTSLRKRGFFLKINFSTLYPFLYSQLSLTLMGWIRINQFALYGLNSFLAVVVRRDSLLIARSSAMICRAVEWHWFKFDQIAQHLQSEHTHRAILRPQLEVGHVDCSAHGHKQHALSLLNLKPCSWFIKDFFLCFE